MLKTLKHFLTQFFPSDKRSESQLNAEEWLYQHASKPEQIELGLERCQEVLKRLKLSQPNFTVITIAGTNGKGSTVQFLDSLLRHEQHRTVGRFTSPHLLRFNERIVIDGEEASDAELLSAFRKIQQAANDIHLTYFEYATLAALVIFTLHKVDVAILEVGLGGRLDASNAVDADVAVITNIALDHQDWLGNDIEVIAREKAGIMRKGKPVILAESDMPKNLYTVANECDASVHQLDKDYSIQTEVNGFRWESLQGIGRIEFFVYEGNKFNPYQRRNLAAAIAALVFAGFEVTEKSIAAAISKGMPKGRMQLIEKHDRTWLLDVAHNPASMQVLCEQLDGLRENENDRFNVVFGMLSDKDSESCVGLLQRYVETWFVAPLDSPRSLSIEGLSKLLGSQDGEFVLAPDIATACKTAAEQDSINPIIVCGSFYTVADALEYLQ